MTAPSREDIRRSLSLPRLFAITDEQRQNICADALKIAKAVNYRSAGTVEFLVDHDGNHYFIEMNPRIQVEHTVTEMTTGIDIVQSQILIAEGYEPGFDEINIKSQDDIQPRGYCDPVQTDDRRPDQRICAGYGRHHQVHQRGRLRHTAGCRQRFCQRRSSRRTTTVFS